jgi:hypothetical protein
MSSASDSNRKADEAFQALFELFSSEKVRRHAHRSCPIDGPSELDLMWETAMENSYAPNLEYRAWVDDLRSKGLIFW